MQRNTTSGHTKNSARIPHAPLRNNLEEGFLVGSAVSESLLLFILGAPVWAYSGRTGSTRAHIPRNEG